MEVTSAPPIIHERDKKPEKPVALGTIRGYLGEYYRTFNQYIDKVAPIDSFSNCYFYSSGSLDLNQINLIRCDEEFVFAIYIIGYPLDSLPSSLPVDSEFGKYTEIQFYPFQSWNRGDQGHYSLDDFYGKNVFITDITNDILTGTFNGTLTSAFIWRFVGNGHV